MTNNRQVRRAHRNDVGAIHDLLAAAGQALVREGFLNWATPYPVERILQDVVGREVYVVESDDELIATYTLGATAARPYSPAPWPEPDATALYLNRMAVAPTLRGHGLGSFLLRQVMLRAQQSGAAAIRCDVLEANPGLRHFYERHGYVSRGRRAHSGWWFACYECPVVQAAPTDFGAPAGQRTPNLTTGPRRRGHGLPRRARLLYDPFAD